MKKYKLTLAICLISNLIFCQNNWSIVNSNTINNLNDIQFTSNYTGYIAGDSGIIMKTSDGGNSWSNLPNNPLENFNSLSFLTDSLGYVSTTNKIYKTIDGGLNWILKTDDTTNYFNVIKFVNEQTGFIGIENKILKTTNGANNWVNIQNSIGDIKSISFPTDSTGYFTGKSGGVGFVYKTVDAGNTFSQLTHIHNTIREEIQFLDKMNGFIIGWYNPCLQRTIDGGQTWQNVDTLFSGGIAVHFLNLQTGFQIDNRGGTAKIFHTNNGGVSWNEELSVISNSVYGLKKLASTNFNILAIGRNGFIYKRNTPLNITGSANDKYFTIFPNPTNAMLNIENSLNTKEQIKVNIADVNGKIIKQEILLNSTINLSELSNGAYVLELIFNDKKSTYKIIKQ